MLNRHQVALYVTHLLVLSSRLFAICYFTDSYKWWVIAVLMFHSCAVVIATVIQNRDKVDCDCDASNVSLAILFMGIHCLREYDSVELSISVEEIGPHETTMRVFSSHILFVLENFFMIVMLYFTYHPNTVGTLYLCVCEFVCSVFLAPQ